MPTPIDLLSSQLEGPNPGDDLLNTINGGQGKTLLGLGPAGGQVYLPQWHDDLSLPGVFGRGGFSPAVQGPLAALAKPRIKLKAPPPKPKPHITLKVP